MKINIKKTELLDILTKNKDKHRAIFLEAFEEYRKQAIKELENSLEEAKAGKKFNRYVSLIVPEDHTKDYVRVIKMVGLDTRDCIDLAEDEFAKYAMDDWQWKQQWQNSVTPYFGGMPAQFKGEDE